MDSLVSPTTILFSKHVSSSYDAVLWLGGWLRYLISDAQWHGRKCTWRRKNQHACDRNEKWETCATSEPAFRDKLGARVTSLKHTLSMSRCVRKCRANDVLLVRLLVIELLNQARWGKTYVQQSSSHLRWVKGTPVARRAVASCGYLLVTRASGCFGCTKRICGKCYYH